MPTITAIERQKRRQRANVYLDGEYGLTLRLDLLATSKLAVGDELGHERRKGLEEEDQRLGAVEAALRLLSMGPRSESELRQRLERRRGFRREAVDAAVERMRELGYLNDAAFARVYVESRQASPRSRRALAFQLNRKGVDRQHVEAALQDHSDEDAAFEAAERRLRALRGLERRAFERRLGNFLASRGFSYGVARSAIDRCWAMCSDEEAPALAGEPTD